MVIESAAAVTKVSGGYKCFRVFRAAVHFAGRERARGGPVSVCGGRRRWDNEGMQPDYGQRKIIHVDMDAFYASVEQRDDETLRGKPVVVAWKGARSVVCAASYEARKFGVRSAMPAVTAERLCPKAVFVPPDFGKYKAVSAGIREIFGRYTDVIEPLSLDEAYLDVTEPKLNLGSATAIAQMIRQHIREELRLTASAGVGPNKFLAKIASDWRKPDGQFVVRPEMVLGFLEALPVGRIPGVGKVMERSLHGHGIFVAGDIRRFSASEMVARFGEWGHRLHELSFGIDHKAVQPNRPHISISAEDTFESDLMLYEFPDAIRSLATRVWSSYERNCLAASPARAARTVVLKLKTSSFRTLTRSVSPAVMPSDAAALAALALELRDRVADRAGERYRLVGVGLSAISSLAPSVSESSGDVVQPELF